ncbi:hypothetical protein B0T16DRAFT_408189 [Cercophora newfieldiana]|uniref:Uncharacterized protein n=1 Tax=Cercophora newfieldiana TaxID=92897 RepID=A0AA39YBB4_9PEZI|nr:hypothetical protein B0T16DRAFT_408189 [Cercophora newfieldiana]
MGYLILNAINQPSATAASNLLGRFVINPHDPLSFGSTPPTPSTIIPASFFDEEKDFIDAEIYISSLRDSNLQVAVRDAIKLNRSRSNTGDLTLTSDLVKSQRINDIRGAFKSLVNDVGVMVQLRKLLAENKKAKSVYLVRGMLLAVNAEMKAGGERASQTQVGVHAALPMELLATPAAPAAGAVIGDVEASRTRQRTTGFSGTVMGTSVFGVEYWECKVKRKSGLKALYQRRKEDDLVFGEAMEPRNEHFGLGSEMGVDDDIEDSEEEDDFGVGGEVDGLVLGGAVETLAGVDGTCVVVPDIS